MGRKSAGTGILSLLLDLHDVSMSSKPSPPWLTEASEAKIKNNCFLF
jgi:hypothetical protein